MTETAPVLHPLVGKRIYVAGHRGMVGSAILRALEARGDAGELLTAGRAELDLTRQAEVERWFVRHRPQAVFLAAARVGGILANASRPAEFISENLAIELNVIEAAHRSGVEKLLFLGSSCIYPKFAPQPLREEALLSGALEPTNEPYAIAKIAGIKMCAAYNRQYGTNFLAVMPANLYGPGDRYDLESAHVLPALMRKAHEAKLSGAEAITIWGTGAPRREFLHADDCADALVHLLKSYSDDLHVNVGSGEDVTILELTQLVCEAVGFKGRIEHDLTKPDGTPRKLMSAERLRGMGWTPRIGLRDGVASTYAWFLEHALEGRRAA